jgi:hypothetical protein
VAAKGKTKQFLWRQMAGFVRRWGWLAQMPTTRVGNPVARAYTLPIVATQPRGALHRSSRNYKEKTSAGHRAGSPPDAPHSSFPQLFSLSCAVTKD